MTALTIAEYAILLRVPALLLLLLILLPFVAFKMAPELLRGLFELTPTSMFVVALTTGAAGGTIFLTANITLLYSHERIAGLASPTDLSPALWAISMISCVPIVVSAAIFSVQEGAPPIRQYLAAAAGLCLAVLVSRFSVLHGLGTVRLILPDAVERHLFLFFSGHDIFRGYVSRGDGPYGNLTWQAHLKAAMGLGVTLAFYTAVGIYGRANLGKARTVPALAAALMPGILLCWIFAGLAFFLDRWHIPILAPAVLWAWLTAQSSKSDHYYNLRERVDDAAPKPPDVLRLHRRPVVIAVNGGGIQAAAWSAQVLQGLDSLVPGFRESLRMISAVSGGSLGSVYYLYSLTDPGRAREPAAAAAESSLDEVAWGLAWPDFLKGFMPWVFGRLFRIGRGRALELAWCLNGASNPSEGTHLDGPLSGWNRHAETGALPALIMNSTLAEEGDRLLLATTEMGGNMTGLDARVDAMSLHTIEGQRRDVGIITGARLSATFPYVTPASRAKAPGSMPHLVDGGYYDTYGMATLVEWLDEALTGSGPDSVEEVLVLQIRGSKIETTPDPKKGKESRGWFYQVLAPIETLIHVRGAGQIAHNEIELQLLQQKWRAKGIPIHNVTFEFPEVSAPLSWHLTRTEKAAIHRNWMSLPVQARVSAVAEFLAGTR